MRVAKHKVVSIDYTLTDGQGTVIDSSSGQQPLVYIHGLGNIIPGLEVALEGKSTGEHVNAENKQKQVYGGRGGARGRRRARGGGGAGGGGGGGGRGQAGGEA